MKKQNICQMSNEFIHVTIFQKKKNIPRNLHFVRAIEKNLRNLALKRLKLQALIIDPRN